MNCNLEIHHEFKNMGEFTCSFCDQQLKDFMSVEKDDMCCDDKELITEHVCRNCGVVDSYETTPRYIDFYENKYKIRRKSVYIRKYHILNVISGIDIDENNNNIQISYSNREKILRIFILINQVLRSCQPCCLWSVCT